MAIEKKINIKVDTGNSKQEIEKVGNATEKVGTKAEKTSGSLDKMTGGAISKFKGLIGSLKSVALGFKSIGFAIAASGIGLLVVGIAAVTAAFKNSEEGQNKFAKIMGVIGSVTGNLIDILAGLGEKIISVFENPKQAIKDFAALIKQNIVNRFEGLLELIPTLGKAVNKLFKGDFSGAAETAANAVAKVALGTENLTDSIKDASKALKDLANEVAEDAKKAAEIANQRAKADKIERQLKVERAIADRKIADFRFKAEQREKFSVSERIEFLKEASKIEDEITKKEILAAKIRFNAQVEENKLAGSKKADLDAEAELQSKLITLDTQRLNTQKRLQTALTGFQREAQTQREAELKARQDEIKEFEKESDSLELENLKVKEEAKTDIIKQSLEKRKEFADKQAKIEEELTEKVNNAKQSALDNTIKIAGEDTKVGKALLVAKQALLAKELIMEVSKTITFSSQAAARSVVAVAEGTAQTAKVGFPQNIPLLIGYAAQAAGIISAITSATSKAGASVSGGRGASVPSTPAPSFNLVQGTESNQIAESLQTTQEPVRAYVVSSEVTTSQSLDRNIEDNATI